MRGARSILGIIIALIIISVTSVSTMFKVISGNVKNFYTMEISDFKKGTLVKGNIYYINTEIGNKGSTHYYVIETDPEDYENSKFIVFSTSDKKIIGQINDSMRNDAVCDIPFKGKLAENDSEVDAHFREMLRESDFDSSEAIFLTIEDYNYTTYTIIGFIVLATIIITAVIVIKKRKNRDNFDDLELSETPVPLE